MTRLAGNPFGLRDDNEDSVPHSNQPMARVYA